MKRAFSARLFEQLPIVGILRGLSAAALGPVVETVREGGLTNLEITMNTPRAADQIRAASDLAGGALNIGAGTVTSLSLLHEALGAGASFIVTPNLCVPIIAQCVAQEIPVFPGALSLAEMNQARELGVRMVKVFPADVFGPSYLSRIKACLPDLLLMPTGGVNVGTLRMFALAGADAFGVGGPLFHPGRMAAQDWEWLRRQCQAFVAAYHNRTPAS